MIKKKTKLTEKIGSEDITFEKLMNELKVLSKHKNVDTFTIGYSLCNRPIPAFHVGQYGDNNIIITGAIHAREWITALLVIELIKFYATADLISCGIYFIPVCNPDGVKISLDALNMSSANKKQSEKIDFDIKERVKGSNCLKQFNENVEGNKEKILWKANARGVDLNVNFDADWGKGMHNVFSPCSENFVGFYPNSEPEVKSLIAFTLKVRPCATIAYHSKGEVIYYGFEPSDGRTKKKQLFRDLSFAKQIGKVTGYMPVKTKNSTGGYSDWVSMHLGIPAITIEVGNDEYKHPIKIDKLSEIFVQNKDVPKETLEYIINLMDAL